MKFFLFFFFAGSLVLVTSCGGGVDCDSTSFANAINDEIAQLNDAGQTYALNPTPENCEKWKDAANEYLDAVDDFKDCDGIDQVQYQQQLDQARAAVSAISCN